MTETKKAPNLRFKGFTDDWEQHKLEEIAEFYNGDRGPNYPKPSEIVEQGVPFINAGDLINGHIDYRNCKHITSDKFNQLNGAKLKINDIVYCLRGTIGKNGLVNSDANATIASSLVCIRPVKLRPLFLFQILNSSIEERQRKMVDEGAAQPNISATNLKKFLIPVPNDNEQEKIGEVFSKLNHLITLQQRKLDKLSLLQKSLLQTLFANDNSEKPELRFSEFKDNWNNKKIGTVFTESKQKSANGQLLSVSIASGVHPFDETERKNNSSQNKSNYKFVEKNDIAYNSMRMWQGSEGVSYYTGIVSPAYTVLHPKEDNNSEFYAYMFKRAEMLNKFRRYSQGLTSDTWNLKFPILKTINIKTTNSDEQTKIVQLFKVIEKHINLEQKKLDRYQSIKKFLLQQMFI